LILFQVVFLSIQWFLDVHDERSMMISTRRLLARPSGVALLAIGLPLPFPHEVIVHNPKRMLINETIGRA
jgi:hypothetical protein